MMFLAVVLLGSLAAAGEEAEVNPVDAFFAEYAEKRDAVQVFEANFLQKQILPDDVITTRGSLIYEKPRRVLLRTEDPPSATLVDGRRLYEYEAEIAQLVIYDLAEDSGADVYFMFFDSDAAQLRRKHEVSLLERKTTPEGRRGLMIRPKVAEGEAPPFMEARVYLRDKDLMPYEIHVELDQDSQLFLNIKDIKVNGTPPANAARIALAPGTTIIENDAFRETVGPDGKLIPEPAEAGPVEMNGPSEALDIETIPAPK